MSPTVRELWDAYQTAEADKRRIEADVRRVNAALRLAEDNAAMAFDRFITRYREVGNSLLPVLPTPEEPPCS